MFFIITALTKLDHLQDACVCDIYTSVILELHDVIKVGELVIITHSIIVIILGFSALDRLLWFLLLSFTLVFDFFALERLFKHCQSRPDIRVSFIIAD